MNLDDLTLPGRQPDCRGGPTFEQQIDAVDRLALAADCRVAATDEIGLPQAAQYFDFFVAERRLLVKPRQRVVRHSR